MNNNINWWDRKLTQAEANKVAREKNTIFTNEMINDYRKWYEDNFSESERKALQKALGVTADGKIGIWTLQAISRYEAKNGHINDRLLSKQQFNELLAAAEKHKKTANTPEKVNHLKKDVENNTISQIQKFTSKYKNIVDGMNFAIREYKGSTGFLEKWMDLINGNQGRKNYENIFNREKENAQKLLVEMEKFLQNNTNISTQNKSEIQKIMVELKNISNKKFESATPFSMAKVHFQNLPTYTRYGAEWAVGVVTGTAESVKAIVLSVMDLTIFVGKFAMSEEYRAEALGQMKAIYEIIKTVDKEKVLQAMKQAVDHINSLPSEQQAREIGRFGGLVLGFLIPMGVFGKWSKLLQQAKAKALAPLATAADKAKYATLKIGMFVLNGPVESLLGVTLTKAVRNMHNVLNSTKVSVADKIDEIDTLTQLVRNSIERNPNNTARLQKLQELEQELLQMKRSLIAKQSNTSKNQTETIPNEQTETTTQRQDKSESRSTKPKSPQRPIPNDYEIANWVAVPRAVESKIQPTTKPRSQPSPLPDDIKATNNTIKQNTNTSTKNPENGTQKPMSQIEDSKTIAQNALKKLDNTEIEKMVSNISADKEFKEFITNNDIIKPRYTAEVAGRKFILSDRFKAGDGRQFAFFFREGQNWLEPNVFYFSESGGNWHYFPGTRGKKGVFSKWEFLSEWEFVNKWINLSYEKWTVVTPELGKIIQWMEVKKFWETDGGEIGYFIWEATKNTKLANELKANTLINDDFTILPHISKHGREQWWNEAQMTNTIRQHYDKFDNFMKGLETQNIEKLPSYSFHHNNLWPSIVDSFIVHHKEHGKIRIDIAYTSDRPDLPWVENIIKHDSPVNSFGMHESHINAGVLTAKPADYNVPDEDLLQALPGSKQINHDYADQRAVPIFQENPMLEFYRKNLQNLETTNTTNTIKTANSSLSPNEKYLFNDEYAVMRNSNIKNTITSSKDTDELMKNLVTFIDKNKIDENFAERYIFENPEDIKFYIKEYIRGHNDGSKIPVEYGIKNTAEQLKNKGRESVFFEGIGDDIIDTKTRREFTQLLLSSDRDLMDLAVKSGFKGDADMAQYIRDYMDGKNDGFRIPDEFGLRYKANQFKDLPQPREYQPFIDKEFNVDRYIANATAKNEFISHFFEDDKYLTQLARRYGHSNQYKLWGYVKEFFEWKNDGSKIPLEHGIRDKAIEFKNSPNPDNQKAT